MRLLNFELPFATMIPDFLYQFLSTGYTVKNSIACLELEDVRELAQKYSQEKELDEIRKFFETGESGTETAAITQEPAEKETPQELLAEGKRARIEKMFDKLDTELEEVDGEYYHAYTPGEIRYIFEKITDKIEKVFELFTKETGTNPALAVGFMLKNESGNELEASMVVEFMKEGEAPGEIEDAFIVPIVSPAAGDGVMARIYIYFDPEKLPEYEDIFRKITDTIGLNYKGDLH